MTAWADFREAVRVACVSASGLPDGAVVWGNAGQPIADPVVRLFLSSVRSPVDVREVRTENEDGTYDVALSKIAECTVQVRTETVAHATAADALAAADYLSLGLRLQAVNAALLTAGVVFVDTLDAVDLAFESGDLRIAARAFDALFRIEVGRTDPTPLGVIEHVKISGEVETPPTVDIPEETIDRPEE